MGFLPHKMKWYLAVACMGTVCAICFFFSCNTSKSLVQHNGFYYWESNFYMQESDSIYLQQLDVKKLYIKFFDVDHSSYDNKPIPAGDIYFQAAIPKDLEIIPVIFITNKTIAKLDTAGVDDLSKKITTRIGKEIKRTQIASQVHELQIDCDWTKTTRDKYFYLLSLIKKEVKFQLSATIRLHQYKYYKNNLPPVDKGLLMCYNVNDPTDFNVNNSLFDKEEVMKYVKNVKYPMPLDLAVPAFSWGVKFNEAQQFTGFTNSLKLKQVESDTMFIKTQRPNVFVVSDYHDAFGSYFSASSMVRIEEANASDVAEVVSYLKSRLNNEDATVILFHYDRLIKENEDQQSLQQIFKAAR